MWLGSFMQSKPGAKILQGQFIMTRAGLIQEFQHVPARNGSDENLTLFRFSKRRFTLMFVLKSKVRDNPPMKQYTESRERKFLVSSIQRQTIILEFQARIVSRHA